MRNFILATAAVVALSFTTSTAKADHNHRSYYRPRCAPYVTPYQAYRYSPSYYGRYNAYRSPYYAPSPIYRYGYGYGYPGYSRSGIGVSGRNFSFYYGF